jgi:DNA invertase Pin-like site-specific DNA recombinase
MSESNGKRVRFAAMPRVSTEKQEQQGESLRTQRKQIEAAVAALGGTVVAWYGGQEHATAGWERAERDRMLADAEKDPRHFDAVMVAHEDRWSRDDTQSGPDLERLRDAGVRFFVLTSEKDLYDPTVRMYLGISAVVGAYYARTQNKKSIENRIERARRGLPACGKLPYGRTFDRETEKWGIDPAKQAMIAAIAERYLAGESLSRLAREYRHNHANLCKLLRVRCGDLWVQEFRADEFGIRETVPTPIPPLLPPEMIRAVLLRLEANRTYLHKPVNSRHDYLLGGRVFCAECGYCLFGQANPSGGLYYRHAHTERKRACPLRPRPWVRAQELEAAVVSDLFNLFGNPAAIERAVRAAVPDCEKLAAQQERLQAELGKIDRARKRILDLIERDALTDAQAEEKLRDLKDRETSLRADLDRVATALADVPDPERVQLFVQHWSETAFDVTDENGERYAGGNSVASLLAMTRDDQRALLDSVFAEPLPGGKPAGVYLTPAGGARFGPKRFTYLVRGRLVEIPGRVAPRALPCKAQAPRPLRFCGRPLRPAG